MTFRRIPIIAFCLALAFDSCTEQKITSQTDSSSQQLDASVTDNISVAAQTYFNSTVGSPIDRQTALRWMGNFSNANKSAVTDYFIQAGTLNGIIANNTCVGISLYYATDNTGQLHIIPVGIDGNGKIIASQTANVDNLTLSWQTVWQWINNYSGSVRSHFLGAQTFIQLLIDQKSQTVRISRAQDDSGNPQLLLSNAADTTPSTYSDESRPCPPYCPNK